MTNSLQDAIAFAVRTGDVDLLARLVQQESERADITERLLAAVLTALGPAVIPSGALPEPAISVTPTAEGLALCAGHTKPGAAWQKGVQAGQ